MKNLVGKFLFYGGSFAVVLLLFRSCSAPQQVAQQPQQQPIPQSQGAIANAAPQPTEERLNQAEVQRNALLADAVGKSNQVLEDLVCTRKEEFLLQARRFQRDKRGTAESFLLGKAKQVQAIALRLNSQQGTFTGSDAELTSVIPVAVDQLAVQVAYEETTNGKPQIGNCVVNLADGLLVNEELYNLATVIERSSPEAIANNISEDSNQ